MFELNETLELNETTLTWVDRTYRTERGLRRFLATLTEAQLEEAEILVDDDTFVVFYPVAVPARNAGPDSAFHFDLSMEDDNLASGQSEKCHPQVSVKIELESFESMEEEEARRRAERVAAFNILLAGVRL